MAILLYLGKPGSGKSAFAVKEMVENARNQIYYTDIIPLKPKLTPQIKVLDSDMIVIKEFIKTVKHKDGTSTNEYKFSLNEKFWQDLKHQRKSIVVDECHKYLDARASQHRVNKIFNDFLALCRRVVDTGGTSGDMIFITQLDRRADVILRDMADEVRYFQCNYICTCKRCGCWKREHNELPEVFKMKICPECGHYDILKHSHELIIKFFDSVRTFRLWTEFERPQGLYYYNVVINDISEYFEYYDTYQWNNMFSKLY